MLIGVLEFEMLIPGATSLKEKRRVVRSLKDRLHREHQVSVAEIGLLDRREAARLGVAAVSASVPMLQSVLDRIVGKLRQADGARLGEVSRMIHDTGSWPDEDDAEPLWTPCERRGDGARS
ncbi:MAG: DUF503 domain-containing protein [Phycisphaerae bacterium]|nr:DUF503 domain-containing protein [Phycisphaerae bacterium]